MNPLDRIDGGGSAGAKTNAILDRTEAIVPRPGGGTGLSQGPSGAAIATLKSWLRKYVQDKSGRREILVTIKQKLASTGKPGWYKAIPALWQGKSSASPTCTTSDFSSTQATGTMTFYNLSQMKSSSDSGCNVPPQISPNDPRPFAGLLIGSDAAATQTKTVIGDLLPLPAMPGVIVTTGPTGQSNFTASATGPQQYWVQQADDSSTDTNGQGTVTLTGTSNAPTVAVTDIGSGGLRLPTGTPVMVSMGYNAATGGVVKAWMNSCQYGAYPVQLVSDGSGSLGSDSTASTWKYYLKDLAGNYIGASSGTGQSPKVSRANGTYAAASWGLAYNDYTNSNKPTLLVAFENRGTGHC